MKILILGGTGTIGGPLAEFLAEDPHNNVYVLARHQNISRGGINYIVGDFSEPFVQQKLCKDHWDAIVDLLWHNDKKYAHTFQLLSDCTDHYIFFSSAAVYADSHDPIKEDGTQFIDSGDSGLEYYHLQKSRMEKIIRESGEKKWSIIRPHVTFNNNRLPMDIWEYEMWLYRAIQGHQILFTEELASKKTTFTYGMEVAKQVAAVVYNGRGSYGEAYNVASKDIYTWGEIIEKIRKQYEEVTGEIIKIKYLESDDPRSRLENFLPNKADRLMYDRLLDRIIDTSKVRALSTYHDTQKYDLDILIRKCIDKKYNSIDKTQIVYRDTLSIAYMDRVLKEKTALRCITNKKSKVVYMLFRYSPSWNTVLKFRESSMYVKRK